MGLLEFYPAFALIAVVGGTWWYGWRQNRRLRTAAAEAAAQLNGRYEPGTHTSGGTLYGKCDGRDVVFVFRLSTTRRAESTSVIAVLKKPARQPLPLHRPRAQELVLHLKTYSRWYRGVK